MGRLLKERDGAVGEGQTERGQVSILVVGHVNHRQWQAASAQDGETKRAPNMFGLLCSSSSM